MINSANPHPVHALLSYESDLRYQVPPYQRAYSWQKAQWEALFQDLVESEGDHFLGTIITLNATVESVGGQVLEVVDGQQRLTTLTLLLAAVYSVLQEEKDSLDDDARTDLVNLGRSLVRKSDGHLRLTPQTQGDNLQDYRAVLTAAGLPVESHKVAYYPTRKMARCFAYFREALGKLASDGDRTAAALRVLDSARKAVLVKIEVASHADAFVLFESLNNRGMPLTPVDLIKNHLLAVADRRKIMTTDEAFARWKAVLTGLGSDPSTHERFLRHYYNAFRPDLPPVPNAPIATRTKLMGIYEALLAGDLRTVLDDLVVCAALYGRISGAVPVDEPTSLDVSLRRLVRAQGSPSYVLVLWLLRKRAERGMTDAQLAAVVDGLVGFFVRRNLAGAPPTYMLPGLFMSIIENAAAPSGQEVVELIGRRLREVSVSDDEFRARLAGPVYGENTDVTRFVLTALAEVGMTAETRQDLWRREKERFVWTIEHIAPQGSNLPQEWKDMLGGAEAAAEAQLRAVHQLGNLTITAYNATLSNKSFPEKRDRTDHEGRPVGYRNGLSLNADLVDRTSWTVEDIDARTKVLADRVVELFPLMTAHCTGSQK